MYSSNFSEGTFTVWVRHVCTAPISLHEDTIAHTTGGQTTDEHRRRAVCCE
jgi:hypothetical protein